MRFLIGLDLGVAAVAFALTSLARPDTGRPASASQPAGNEEARPRAKTGRRCARSSWRKEPWAATLRGQASRIRAGL
jgi:hypothetical protein